MAVYTELTRDDIAAFLHDYDLPPLVSTEGIRSGVENTNYRLGFEGDKKLILTLFEKRISAEELPFFVALMERYATHHVPCPVPVRARDGQALRQLKQKPAMMVTFLEGASVTSIRQEHVAELGTHLARLHLAGQDFPQHRANTLSLAGWRGLLTDILPRADEITAGLGQELQTELAYLEQHWPQGLPSGIIHADLFPDNVFFDAHNHLSGLIDFYFACNDLLAYDIAICINAWCFDASGACNPMLADTLLHSYDAVRPLSQAERNALPILLRGAALRFLLTRSYARLFPVEDALVTPHNPMEYIAKLRFHRG